MNKISTLIAASALAILPLTGAHAEFANPADDGFSANSTQSVQGYFTSKNEQRIVPVDGRLQQPRHNTDAERFDYAGDGSINSK